MAAHADATLISYRLSQYAVGICPSIELTVQFQATPENVEPVDEAAEAAIRALIKALETRYPGVPVGTERTYTSQLTETEWYAPAGPAPEDPGNEPPPASLES
ncbi:hypothetical protein ACFYY2_17335 [Streptomyces sp. NPDC001822]|uniref:hypothetical protein n=1 Tax=Streptomyces sp. NPDC001822 TaxID=3364614 RepID=UPI003690C193